jgi:hypothetical protein
MSGRRVLRLPSVLLPLFLAALSLSLAGCGEFLGFVEFPEPDTGDIMKIRLFLTDSSLSKLYDSVREDDYAPCIYEESGKRTQALVKVRGFTSRIEYQKNFTVRIEVGSERIMYALDSSGASIKNALAMYAYRTAGLPAPRTEPVALFVNGEYLGCYTRVEMYTEDALREHYGAGGELFKCHFSDLGLDFPLQDRSEKKFPDDEDFTNLNTFVYNAKYLAEPTWSSWVDRYIDVDEIIKYMVVHDFLAVYDTAKLNFYVYNYGKLLVLPWDNEESMKSGLIDLYGDNLLLERIVADPIRRALYDSEMQRLFLDGASLDNMVNDLYDEADRLFTAIETAVLNDPFVHLSLPELQNENQAVLDFLTSRPVDPDLNLLVPKP